MSRNWRYGRWLVFVALCLGGCGSAKDAREDKTATVERWYSIYLQGNKVGHARDQRRTIEHNGETLIEITTTQELAVGRGADDVRTRITFIERMTSDGALREFEQTYDMGSKVQRARGVVTDGELHVTDTTAGERRIPWPDGALGGGGWQLALKKTPLAPGDTRKGTSLHESMFVPVAETVTSDASEVVKMRDGARRLIPIDRVVEQGELSPQTTRFWIDERGDIVRAVMDSFGMEIQLATRKEALAPSGTKVDLVYGQLIPVTPALEKPREAKLVRYRIRTKRGDPARLVPGFATQAVVVVNERTIDVTVRSSAYGDGDVDGVTFDAETRPATERDLAANAMLQCDDKAIVDLANDVVQGESDPSVVALALARHVHDFLKDNVTYREAFATAADVAKSREGDCTEHAVLLAAMLRARKIPSRTALGMVYMPEHAAFGFHMWAEAWLGGAWVGLDATTGEGTVAADHIKLAATGLDAGLSDPAPLRVAEMLGAGASVEILPVR